jgi:hypothetical protein
MLSRLHELGLPREVRGAIDEVALSDKTAERELSEVEWPAVADNSMSGNETVWSRVLTQEEWPTLAKGDAGKKTSRVGQSPAVRVQSHGDIRKNESVSQQQSTAEATVKTFSCRQKKRLVASPVTLPKVCLGRLDKSLHQKAPIVSSTVQSKKVILTHKRSAQEVIVTPTPEVIVTPISKDISRISKRRRLCQKDSAAQSGDLPQVILSDSSDKAGHKLEVLFKKLESELTIIRRASSRAEELYERIRTLRSV